MSLFKKITRAFKGGSERGYQEQVSPNGAPSSSDGEEFSTERLGKLLDDSDWHQARDEIHTQIQRATTTEQRVALLAVYQNLMDSVQAQVPPEALDKFKTTRAQDYRLLLTYECIVGTDMSAEDLDRVTRREVSAGRLAPDDEFRLLAIATISEPHFSRNDLLAMHGEKSRAADVVGSTVTNAPEVSESDMVRVQYALTELFNSFQDSAYLDDLFVEHSADNQEPFINAVREAMRKHRPRIDSELEFFRSLGLTSADEQARKTVIVKAMGSTALTLGAAWRESLESLTPDGQEGILKKHRVPPEWLQWYMALRKGKS